MKHYGFIPLLILSIAYACTGQNLRTFYVGHSLADGIPDMVQSLADNHPTASFDNWIFQIGIGAGLEWQWQHKALNNYQSLPPHYYGFYDPSFGLRAGGFKAVVLTESVPRFFGNNAWDPMISTYQFADSFYTYAARYNPGIQGYIYEIWHCLKSGTPTGCAWDINASPWRQRLADDLRMWESIVDTLNARHKPAKPVCLIPGGQGLARLHDAIKAGSVPGISNIESIFSDDIHLTDVGRYFIACIHFAMLHRQSPVGLTHQLYSQWGVPYTPPTPAQALRFQQIAWETVTQYPKTCLTTTAVEPNITDSALGVPMRVQPNPAQTAVVLLNPGDSHAANVYNSLGTLVRKHDATSFDVSDLAPGIYFVVSGAKVAKFVKN
jgi:hypothetical protein